MAVVFASLPPSVRAKMMTLRALIFDTAAATEGVGELEETLRWGEPAYLTTQSQSGSMIRINFRNGKCAVYFLCQTSLVATFREAYPDTFTYEGNRAIVLPASGALPTAALGHCIALALTYRVAQRPRQRG